MEDIANEYNVLCITETHLDENISIADLTIEPFRRDRNFAGGGVIVCLSEMVFCQRRRDIESENFEAIWVEIKIDNIIIMLCYRPPKYQQSVLEISRICNGQGIRNFKYMYYLIQIDILYLISCNASTLRTL